MLGAFIIRYLYYSNINANLTGNDENLLSSRSYKFIPCYKSGREQWSSAGFTNLNRKQKFIPVAELSDMLLSVSGYLGRAVSREKAVSRKNRDEFMNYTVRVMRSIIFN